MTQPVDKLSEKIAAAQALPEAIGFEASAENLARREHLSLPQIAEMLRAKQSARAALVSANMAKAQGAAGDASDAAAPPRNQISSAAPVAATRPAAASTRSNVPTAKAVPVPAPAASRQAVDDLWAEIVADLNAEHQQGMSKPLSALGAAPSKADPWDEIVSDLNAQNARSGSPT
jgi:hypothetical protein